MNLTRQISLPGDIYWVLIEEPSRISKMRDPIEIPNDLEWIVCIYCKSDDGSFVDILVVAI